MTFALLRLCGPFAHDRVPDLQLPPACRAGLPPAHPLRWMQRRRKARRHASPTRVSNLSTSSSSSDSLPHDAPSEPPGRTAIDDGHSPRVDNASARPLADFGETDADDDALDDLFDHVDCDWGPCAQTETDVDGDFLVGLPLLASEPTVQHDVSMFAVADDLLEEWRCDAADHNTRVAGLCDRLSPAPDIRVLVPLFLRNEPPQRRPTDGPPGLQV